MNEKRSCLQGQTHPVAEAGRPEVHPDRPRKLQEAARNRVATEHRLHESPSIITIHHSSCPATHQKLACTRSHSIPLNILHLHCEQPLMRNAQEKQVSEKVVYQEVLQEGAFVLRP